MTDAARSTPEDVSQLNSRAFRNALGQYPTGVTIITSRSTGDSGGDIGMTMNSFSTVSLDPPLVLFCVDKRALSLAAWQTGQAYGISVLSEGQDEVSNRFAKALNDKWANVPLRRGVGGVALIKGALAHLECTPYAQYEGGDHVIFVVRVERYHVTAQLGPLAFCKGRYNHLQPGAIAPPDWPLPIHY